MSGKTLPKVELVPTTVIKPYWRNPRDNNEAAVQAVAKSISEFGFNSPIILDKDSVIINGHTRHKAAQLLGLESVPCVVLDDLPPDKVREYRIADNKSAELSKWNENLLPELRELIDIQSMQIYFGAVDLSSMLIDPSKIEIPEIKSQEQIDKRKDQMENKFAPSAGEQFIEATCPHCFENFNVDRAYVMEKLGIEA